MAWLRSALAVILGLSLATGAAADTPPPLTRYVVHADVERIEREWSTDDPDQVLEGSSRKIAARLKAMGAPEHSVTYIGNGQMVVDLHGTGNRALLESALGIPVDLKFRIVAKQVSEKQGAKGIDMVPTKDSLETLSVLRSPSISGLNLVLARAILDPVLDEYSVELAFDSTGTEQLARMTTMYVGGQLALVLDGEIIRASRILEPITEGRMQISGGFSFDEATDLAIRLQAGSGPSLFEIVEVQLVE
ncbi:hypothetical protein KUW15_01610 [Qipengyuania aquimaris]|uniref:SecDF P1 head subdomain-containing protein n=1 Tax=Qipengyuania aquimaris TaxID=255984 RepID=UPI001C96D63E|nr:hypothetical protein [Qipengyuania aquimaris]MBY6127404.1 hypothetical protein [Qipengyuania aquimaris]